MRRIERKKQEQGGGKKETNKSNVEDRKKETRAIWRIKIHYWIALASTGKFIKKNF